MSRSLKGIPPVVIISGPDGSGKTTQARIIVGTLRKQGVNAHYRWIRFIHLLSLPLLAYATIRGYTQIETLPNGRRTGIHTFWQSELVARIYPCVLYLDMVIAKIIYLDIPSILFGRVIVCDRFVVDAVIDIMIDTRGYSFHKSRMGFKFLKLNPTESVNVVLTSDLGTILARRSYLVGDRTLEKRIELYATLARDLGIRSIDGSRKIEEVAGDLRRLAIKNSEHGEISI
jgi:thymidylate kinase